MHETFTFPAEFQVFFVGLPPDVPNIIPELHNISERKGCYLCFTIALFLYSSFEQSYHSFISAKDSINLSFSYFKKMLSLEFTASWFYLPTGNTISFGKLPHY